MENMEENNMLKYPTMGAQIPDARAPVRIHVYFRMVAPNISGS